MPPNYPVGIGQQPLGLGDVFAQLLLTFLNFTRVPLAALFAIFGISHPPAITDRSGRLQRKGAPATVFIAPIVARHRNLLPPPSILRSTVKKEVMSERELSTPVPISGSSAATRTASSAKATTSAAR